MIIGYLQPTLGLICHQNFNLQHAKAHHREIHNIQRHGSHFKHQANTLVATNGAENMPFRAA